MSIDRRLFLGSCLSVALAGPVAAQSYGQTFRVDNDDGRPLANMRLPGEISGQIAELHGVTYVGPRDADVTLYEFFDYNCSWCRRAALDLAALTSTDPALRIGIVNNPILSPQSAQAAKVALAVQHQRGSAAAFAFYLDLLKAPSRIDGLKALDLAQRTGLSRSQIESIGDGDDVRSALRDQMRLALNLGLSTTPAYVLGNVGVLGHPGPRSLAGMVADMRRCDLIVCG